MVPKLSKPDCLGIFKALRHPRKYTVKRAAAFLQKFPLLGFAIQAPQALATLTGYGLQLGSIMGFISDSVWGAVRIAQGKTVVITGPPPSDPAGKAARYLSQPRAHYHQSQAFSLEDHLLLMAADAIAIQIIAASTPPTLLEQRADVAVQTPIPLYEPWNPASLDMLNEEGWDLTQATTHPIPDLPPDANYLQLTGFLSENFTNWNDQFAREIPPSFKAQAINAAAHQAGELFFEWSGGGPDAIEPIFEPEEIAIAHIFRYQVYPPHPTTAEQFNRFILRSLQRANARGAEIPNRQDLQDAAQETFRGWAWSPPTYAAPPF